MYRFNKHQVIISFATVLVLLFSGCGTFMDAGRSGIGSETDGAGETPGEKKTVFNEGKVDYAVLKKEVSAGVFPEDKLGTVAEIDDEGVEILFESDFEDGDVTCGEEAVEYSKDSCSVHNGMLSVPAYDENASSHGWTTWAPKAECFTEDYFGAQISFDCKISSDGKAAWESPFFGLFKDSLTTIADNNSGGIYFSVNAKTGKITVYCDEAGKWSWPQGNISVGVDPSLFSEIIHIDIVNVARDRVIMFMNGSKVLEMVFDGKTQTYDIFDKEGKNTGKGTFDPDIISGPYFQIFTHLGSLVLDDIKILGFSKGAKKVETYVTATPREGFDLGLDITDKKDIISICYSCWHNAINGGGTGPVRNVSNVTEMLETYDFTAEKGFVNKSTGETSNAIGKFHYWGKPAQGYYRSSDTGAIRNNMKLLYEAGVDFIIIDFTFATAPGYAPGTSTFEDYIYSSVVPLLDTVMLMRAEGAGTPYVVFWMGNDSMFEYMDEYFLSVEKWKDCFVYWDGKPFIMKWTMDESESYDKWTVRGMYGLSQRASLNQWSYLEIDNSKTVSYDREGNPEHMCVDVATQETYMSVSTAHGRQGGRFFNMQWKNAFAVHPKIVTVTWWNEWCAQLYYVDGVGYIFTDNFNEEYSRDIEPQDGANGDTYYKWLKTYISDYRAGKKCPELVK